MLVIKTLGGLEISLNSQPVIDIGSRKAEALLVYLAVENESIPRAVLANLLWPESSQKHACSSLRVALSKLHKAFGDYVVIGRETVHINPQADVYVDIRDLEEKLSKGEIEHILRLYQGDFLAGFQVVESGAFEDWQRGQNSHLSVFAHEVLQAAVIQAMDTKDYGFGLKIAQKLLDIDPLDEKTLQFTMQLYAFKGDRTAAIEQYEAFEALLKSELAVSPSPDTSMLYERISQGELHLLRPLDREIDTLPLPGTTFVGRQSEIFQIHRRIRDPQCRLLTLVGPGGCGKTRLAMEVAKLSSEAFHDGLFFVPFEGVQNADAIVPAIARGLNFFIDDFASRLDPEVQLCDYLARRALLLILDGFEGMVPHAERLLPLLIKAPSVKFLVTSRHTLDLAQEWVFRLDGLPVPGDDDEIATRNESVRLFIDRASQIRGEFYPSHEDYRHIIQICRMVEGMPLGIELAASWSSILSVEKIEQEVIKSLDFLTSKLRNVPDRHRSIRAIIEGSWALLDDPQRKALESLTIFEDAFDQQAAQQVTHADLAQLVDLVDKSLLKTTSDGRFGLHRMIKQYIGEKRIQNETLNTELKTRYSSYYLEFLTSRTLELMGARMLATRQEIRHELPHVTTAVRWMVMETDNPPISQLLTSLLAFFAVHGWFEGVETFRNLSEIRLKALREDARSNPESDPVVLSCRVHQAFLQCNLGQIDESEALSCACLTPLREHDLKPELSECLHNLGVNASFRGEHEVARALLEEAIKLGRECEHIFWPTYLLWLGHVYFLLGEYERGLLSLQKCRGIFLENGNLWGAAFAISKMGLAADGLGEHEKALSFHQEAFTVFEQINNETGKGYSLSRMSMSAYFLGDFYQAVRFGQESLQLFKQIDHRWGISSSLSRIGFAHLALDQTESAREDFVQSLQLSQQEKMVPLSLYALAGIACVRLKTNNLYSGLDLLGFVANHPKMVKAFLDQAFYLINSMDKTLLNGLPIISNADDLPDRINEIIQEIVISHG